MSILKDYENDEENFAEIDIAFKDTTTKKQIKKFVKDAKNTYELYNFSYAVKRDAIFCRMRPINESVLKQLHEKYLNDILEITVDVCRDECSEYFEVLEDYNDQE